jgi:ACS family D-galactonate transporter-like MFS transporter
MKNQSKVRYGILAMIFVNVVINYMDRSNISVAGLMVQKELQFDNIKMGYVFSAFAWTYASLQIPGSILVDRIGTRILYCITLIGWSVATFCLGLTYSFFTLILLRVLIGAFEAPSYPMNNQIVTSWFPEKERASAIATYTSGQFLGLAFLAPVLFFVEAKTGWRGLFFITGIVGIIWGFIWYFLYRSPSQHKRVSNDELKYIEEGGGVFNRDVNNVERTKFKWSNLIIVLSQRKLWGIYIGQFCLGGAASFFLTWFPKYLVDYRKMDFIQSGFYTAIPFIAAFTGILLSGFLSDYLVRKNVSAAVARKAPIITGLLLSMSIVFANYVTQPGIVIFFMALAFFGNGFASITWVFVSLLAPKNLLGLTGGTFNLFGGLASITIPIVIGHLAENGNFAPALIFISCLALVGAMSYIFLVGKVERVVINE